MMGIARRRRSAARGTLLTVALLVACTVIPARLSGNRYVYEDLPVAGGFPVEESILIGYVDAQDLPSRLEGMCFAESVASDRPDAWRCMVGNLG